jgi:hypothetical protein
MAVMPGIKVLSQTYFVLMEVFLIVGVVMACLKV